MCSKYQFRLIECDEVFVSESPLIDLDDAVDLRDKPEGREESDSSGEKKENEGQEERVSEVENRRRRALDRQLARKNLYRIYGHTLHHSVPALNLV